MGDWGYYAKQVAGSAGQMLKVWIRWNAETSIYDYYLESNSGSLFNHDTPYVGTVR